MARDADPISRGSILCYTYITAASMGALQMDEDILRQTDEMYSAAQNGKDSYEFHFSPFYRGIGLLQQGGASMVWGRELLDRAREIILQGHGAVALIPVIDFHIAQHRLRTADLDGAVELARTTAAIFSGSVTPLWLAPTTDVLVEALVRREAMETSRRRVQRSNGWRVCPQIPDSSFSRSGCSTRVHSWRAHAETRLPIANTETDTERWLRISASKDTSRWPRRCRDAHERARKDVIAGVSRTNTHARVRRRTLRTPTGGAPPTAGPPRSRPPATAASPRQKACPPTESTAAGPCGQVPTAPPPPAGPSR